MYLNESTDGNDGGGDRCTDTTKHFRASKARRRGLDTTGTGTRAARRWEKARKDGGNSMLLLLSSSSSTLPLHSKSYLRRRYSVVGIIRIRIVLISESRIILGRGREERGRSDMFDRSESARSASLTELAQRYETLPTWSVCTVDPRRIFVMVYMRRLSL